MSAYLDHSMAVCFASRE